MPIATWLELAIVGTWAAVVVLCRLRSTFFDNSSAIEGLQQRVCLSQHGWSWPLWGLGRRLLSCVVFEAPFLITARQLKASNNVYAYRNMVGAGHCGDLG